jgi:hypothetical protein
VEGASSNQRINEPWGYYTGDPDSPDVAIREYEIVIYTTGPAFNQNTIQDTTQTFLKAFTFAGGKVMIMGDRILQDLTDPETSVDPEFMPGVLAATPHPNDNGIHPSAFLDSDFFPTAPSGGAAVNPLMDPGDSLHLYSGCDIVRPSMDKIRIETNTPAWANPGPYLVYEDDLAPYDSLAGIYNVITFNPVDPGQAIYIPFSLEAIVDSTTIACDPPPGTAGGMILGDEGYGVFQGRMSLIADALMWFGENLNVINEVTPHVGGGLVTALHPAQPNPFNPTTTLSFDLAARGHVQLEVYDVMGRRVRTLVNEVRDAGRYQLMWDGKNSAGRSVASGLYFARMEAEGFTATEKMTLLK